MKLKKPLLLISLLFFICGNVFAATESPGVLMKSLTTQTVSALKAKQNSRQIIQSILMPHVLVAGMSRTVVGRNYWNTATPQQQNQFIDNFSKMITQTYATALDNYTDQAIRFYPIRGGYAGKTRVRINSIIDQNGGPPIHIQYRLMLTNNQWKLYDMVVEGVSLLQSYSAQFAPTLKSKGMSGLLSDMIKHNQKR